MALGTRSIAEGLPGLHDKALATITGRSPCPVATYRLIQSTVAGSNLTDLGAESVRRRFNGYYGVRRNADWRSRFYKAFETAKGSSLGAVELFEATLIGLHANTQRVEASFVSKLVATLRPDAPIVDSVVRKWLVGRSEPQAFGGGLAPALAYYQWLHDQLTEVSLTSEAQAWGQVFALNFPQSPREPHVSAMKQLDFLIWAGADRQAVVATQVV